MDAGRAERITVPFLVGLLLLLLWVATTWWLFEERQRVVAARSAELAKLTTAVEEQTLRLFKLNEASIQAAANWIEEHPGAFPPGDPAFIKLVGDLRRITDGSLEVRLIDRAGNLYPVPAASRQPVANVARNEDIAVQLDPATRGLYIGDPIRSRVTGSWIVPVTYPVVGRDRELLLIVAAVFELDRLTRIFEPQRDKPNGSITILKTSGTTLFRTPATEGSIGRSIAKAPDFIEHLSPRKRGQYRIRGAFDGVDRLISHVRLEDYPLIVAVTASMDDALDPWRGESLRALALMLAITIVTTLLTRRYLRHDRRSRLRLEKSEQRFRALLERAPDPTWIIDRGRIVECNQAAVQILGYPDRDAFLALDPASLSPPRQPDGEDSSRKAERMVALAGETGLHRFEWVARKADGSDFDAEITLSLVELDDRTVLYCVGRDITARKRAENQAERERLRLDTILRTASDGIHILDGTGLLVEANSAFLRMLGYDESAIGTLRVTDWDAQRSWTEIESILGQLISHRAHQVFETRHRRRDGVILDVEISAIGIEIEGQGFLYAASRDITARKRVEADLRVAATTFESREGIFVTDADARILRTNRAFSELTGYAAEEVVGQNPRLLSSGLHDQAFYTEMWSTIANSGSWRGEIWNRKKSGEIFPEFLSITAVRSDDGRVSHYVASFSDITERKLAAERIEHLAFYDSLTELPNRRLMIDRLGQAMSSCARHRCHGALMLIDLDNFKTLNDTLGHDVGDQLLVEVAARLEASIRECDTVARLGGDEFVVILQDLDESMAAAIQVEVVAVKIQTRLSQHYQLTIALGEGEVATRTHYCTSSVGITLFRDASISTDEVLKRADTAMYQAKAAGRNTLRFFDPKMQETVAAAAALEIDLRKAVLSGQFRLHYQPQVDSAGRILGAEALVRWQHPDRGLVPPAEFIPLAENTGLIVPLGHWVLETACRQLAEWARCPELAHVVVAVNVSARQFALPDWVDQVAAVIDHTRCPPGRLKLELTESLLLENAESTIAKMLELKARGVGFSLDDFGTGYSSLTYLKRLPLDQLKIDQSFVRDVLVDPNDTAIVRTVVALGQSMGLAVIAEGVETEGQRSFLESAGCHAYQGYLFSRPLPVEGFVEYAEQLLAGTGADRTPSP